MDNIIYMLKRDTNDDKQVIYRKKKILFKNIYIIFNETLCSSSSISDFIIRSLDKIRIPLYKNILNKINNFKYKEIDTYGDICKYINSGFTVILFDSKRYIALETKKDLSRGVSQPITENTPRGPLDSFTENIETNIGLIKRRIKSNDLWFKNYELGKYTKSKISLLYINGIAKEEIVDIIDKRINNIDIDGIIASGTIRNLIEKENKSPFPDILSTEKPYTAIKYLLDGHIVIVVDNDPFVLILPVNINDFFLSEEDDYNKSVNVTLTRIIRYVTFAITLLTPGIYLALTTFNQEIIPLELLTSIAAQRENVPFSGFIECLLMIGAFEILRESDLKIPSYASSALSIVGALILGEAAVSAGIVSPIMIIVVAITAISSLIFIEPEFISALRIYRILFMIGASILGVYGVLLVFILFLINLSSCNFLYLPYLTPFAPPNKTISNSIIKLPSRFDKFRNKFLSKNNIKLNLGDKHE